MFNTAHCVSLLPQLDQPEARCFCARCEGAEQYVEPEERAKRLEQRVREACGAIRSRGEWRTGSPEETGLSHRLVSAACCGGGMSEGADGLLSANHSSGTWMQSTQGGGEREGGGAGASLNFEHAFVLHQTSFFGCTKQRPGLVRVP